MPRVKVTISNFKGNKFVRQHIATIRNLSERHLQAIAEETVKVIRQKITERIERQGSTGNLANSMTAIPITGGWGVGDISFLNSQAPYWYWQNYGVAQSGRRIPPRSGGEFQQGNPRPVSSGGNARWGQPGGFMINPQKPISPKNYIQATINEINKIVQDVVRRVKL